MKDIRSINKMVKRLLLTSVFLGTVTFVAGCSNAGYPRSENVTDLSDAFADNTKPENETITPSMEEESSTTTVTDETGTNEGAKEEKTDGGNEPAGAGAKDGKKKESDDGENESTEAGTAVQMSRIEKTVLGAGYEEGEQVLTAPPEIRYEYSDGYYEYYSFDHAGEEFEVLHEYDNWKISDSYKIRNSKDMQLICEALLDIYPVHGADLESYRTPEDMAYEWIQHNIVYEMPLTDSSRKESAANVDLDPKDQNKTILEMFKDRQ